ncbi:MAG: hypothetical protein PQJ60_15315, partial [Spirochaetales bacterium]|nr:hypothetical protein [Spirochaetales bacterium]
LSSFSGDLQMAQLVLKAFRNDEMRDRFFQLAFTTKTALRVRGSFRGGNYYAEPNLESGPVSEAPELVELLAINPQVKGEALPWYLAVNGVGEYVWVYSGNQGEVPVTLVSSPSDSIAQRPAIADKSVYSGSGVRSVCLFPGLSFFDFSVNAKGEEYSTRLRALDMGEVVYAQDEVKEFNKYSYVKTELPGALEGWALDSYIARDAKPAVILEDGVSLFKEPKPTALSTVTLMRNQIIAVHSEKKDGFLKVSFVNPEDKRLYKDLYIQSGMVSFSYSVDDIAAAILLYKISGEEDQAAKDVYFENALSFSSYLSEEWGDLYYGEEEAAPVEEVVDVEAAAVTEESAEESTEAVTQE